MKKTDCPITAEGLSKLKQQVASLRENVKEIDEQMREIALSEDTSENMEYQELRNDRIGTQIEIDRLLDVIDHAYLIDERSFSEAEPGCRINLANHQICYMFQLVSSLEANSLEGKVSCSSPLGNSLLGKRVGDEVEVPTPMGKINFKIMSLK